MNSAFTFLDPRNPSVDFRGKCALTVMAKAPVAGQVKTRLTPPLTQEQAAGLSACFLKDTVVNLENAASVTDARWVVSYWPSGAEAAFRGILPRRALLLSQRGNTFGERLLRTAEDILACGFSSVCLIDSDSPTVPMSAFVQAVEELAASKDRLVLGPSMDGGYYLLGLNLPHKYLFEEILWSTPTVADQTRERARHLGLTVISLPTWYDVDEARSLRRLRRELVASNQEKSSYRTAYRAPFTRAYIEKIGCLLNDAGTEAEIVENADVLDSAS